MGCAFCVGSEREASRQFTRHDTTWHHKRQKYTPNENSKADQHLALATAVATWCMRHPKLVESCFAPSNPPSSPPLSSLDRLSGPKDGLGYTGDVPRDTPPSATFLRRISGLDLVGSNINTSPNLHMRRERTHANTPYRTDEGYEMWASRYTRDATDATGGQGFLDSRDGRRQMRLASGRRGG
jgi:hypothetical protein